MRRVPDFNPTGLYGYGGDDRLWLCIVDTRSSNRVGWVTTVPFLLEVGVSNILLRGSYDNGNGCSTGDVSPDSWTGIWAGL